MTSENEALEKKLGFWGIDRIVREDNKIYAEDYYCFKCYRESKKVRAEVFWPNIDLDITPVPYCKPCKDELAIKIILG
ncbi:MAG: hypothetical protein Q8Q04_01800 [archaeon]|nr:hypothetical protein [archaeon]